MARASKKCWLNTTTTTTGVGAVYYHLILFIFRQENRSEWKIQVHVLISTIDNINKNYKWSLTIGARVAYFSQYRILRVKVLDIHYS